MGRGFDGKKSPPQKKYRPTDTISSNGAPRVVDQTGFAIVFIHKVIHMFIHWFDAIAGRLYLAFWASFFY